MLLNRERATAGRVPRALMAGPAPGIVVTTFGEKGKPLELTSLEIDQLTRWMRASIPAYRKLFQQHAEYDLFRRRENAARSNQALRYRQEVGVVPAIAFGPSEDPEGWLGRQYTAYEKSLMMGPEPMCSKYNKVNIGGVFYRTRDGDKGKVTTQCFVRASFPKNDADADDEWEDRNVGARYKSTPQSAKVVLAAADRTRGNAVLQSSWDTDVVKRVAKDTLGTKASSFSGSEPHRQLLWDSLVTALEASFVNKDNANEDIFDLVDVTKEVHPIFNDILLRALVSLTTPHSPAREEPLVAQFDECLKAIAASGAGPLDDEAAKRQLLAALDTEFYKEVITPLRLDTELAKASIEEVYTHILEGIRAQGARSISFHSASSAFVQECPLCPGHFHDTARCPEVCGSCDVDLRDAAMDLDEVVSAFQTAFDNENDEDFADLCHEHDQPLVRTDPEPFTYPVRHDVGLHARYAGLGHGASGDGMEDVLSDARGVLESLRSAATAAQQFGGATVAGEQPLHIGTLSVPQVVCDAPPPVNHEIDTGLCPVSASDPASFGSPFEEPLRVSFMDRVMPACPDTSLKLYSIDSVHESIHPGELSVIDDDDDSDGFSYSGDGIPSAPPATRSRVGVATLPRVFSFVFLALPALMCLACVSAVQGSVVLDRDPEFTAAVHPTGVTANSLSALPYTLPFGIPFPSVVSAGLNSDFQFSEFLILLYESFPASGFWSWLLDYDSGFWLWILVSGLWFWIMTSGLWFWLNIFDTDNFFNSGELCNFVDHFESG
ncbi:hypothetical protein CYMTET_56938 [Cymbomonas tetramitiformis]|uniref:Transmembrane protein n=1 Tax=Cymbomonas tetramitiformis TaxID=36881 RepID=A0AAE0EN92_9CHLO|nr:hypothetical protein CYMTET_56938 [Cymbomonas tetramitiformis]